MNRSIIDAVIIAFALTGSGVAALSILILVHLLL